MKKNRFIIILTLLLFVVAFLFVYKNNSSSIRKEDRDFAVKDTSEISKVFIADRNGSTVTLERKSDNSWMVNGKYKVRQEAISLLFDCFSRVSVQSRVPKAAYNAIIKELSSTGIKCEIYKNGKSKPFKIYYVGGSTQDVLGTYMMLENSTVPFITEIPGFNGYLTPRYSPIERDWRETVIVNYRLEEINSVTIQYNTHPERSFVIERLHNVFSVYSPVSNRRIDNPDTLKINIYLTNFLNLNFEAWDRNFSNQQTDSLRHSMPVTVLTIVDVKGNKAVLPMYLKPLTETSLAQTDSSGNVLKYDLDRMYGFINDGPELVTLQYFVFGKIFASIDDFDFSKRQRTNK